MKRVGVILAAGGSTRMGRPKALFPVGGVPLVRLHQAVLETQCSEVRVVVGAFNEEIAGVLGARAVSVPNPRWAESGPRESLLLALAGLADDTRVVITPVDVPPATRGALARLTWTEPPAALGHAGQAGHPVQVEAGRARAVLLAGGTLKDVVGETPKLVEAGPDVLRNLNTPEEWTAWTRAPLPEHLPGYHGVKHVCPACGEPVSADELQALLAKVLPSQEAARVAQGFHRDTGSLRAQWACARCVATGTAILADRSAQAHRSGPPIYVYVDRTLRCATCHQAFVHTAAEQQAFYEQYRFPLFDGPADPADCGSCRFQKRERTRAQRRAAELRTHPVTTPQELVALAEALRAAGSRRRSLEILRQAKNRAEAPELRAAIVARIEEWGRR